MQLAHIIPAAALPSQRFSVVVFLRPLTAALFPALLFQQSRRIFLAEQAKRIQTHPQGSNSFSSIGKRHI